MFKPEELIHTPNTQMDNWFFVIPPGRMASLLLTTSIHKELDGCGPCSEVLKELSRCCSEVLKELDGCGPCLDRF